MADLAHYVQLQGHALRIVGNQVNRALQITLRRMTPMT
jgi:hypothetical protein